MRTSTARASMSASPKGSTAAPIFLRRVASAWLMVRFTVLSDNPACSAMSVSFRFW